MKYQEANEHSALLNDAFDISVVALINQDGTKIWFDNALTETIKFYRDYFDQNNS